MTFDKSLLQSEVKELKCAQAENQVEPENAYVALEGSEFTIVPETEGSKLKVKEAYKALDTAISGSQTSIDLGNTPDVYAVAAVTSDDPTLQATRDAYNNYTKASITYTFGEQTVTLLTEAPLRNGCSLMTRDSWCKMMLPLPSISRILWHSWQVSMTDS